MIIVQISTAAGIIVDAISLGKEIQLATKIKASIKV
jgi:hypothetical protein